MKKVLILTNVIKPGGGPAGYTFNLLNGLNKIAESVGAGGEIAISNMAIKVSGEINPNRTSSVWRMTPSGADVVKRALDLCTAGYWRTIKQNILHFSPSNDEKRDLIRKADVVVFQGFQDPTFLALARRLKKKTVYMPHSPTCMAEEYLETCKLEGVQPSASLFKKHLNDERSFITGSDFIVFPSRNSRLEYLRAFRGVAHERCRYIESGVDIEMPERKLPNEEDATEPASRKTKVLFAGRYITHKGFDLFLELAKYASTISNDFYFVSAGGGSIPATVPVHDLGWRKDIHQVIGDADIVVIPNRVAYYDLLPLEVAALGKPLLFTPVGGNIDQSGDLPHSICCSAVNAESLMQALVELSMRIKKNPDYGRANQEAYYEKFATQHLGQRWCDFLSEI